MPSSIYAFWPVMQGNSQGTGISNFQGPDNLEIKWSFKGDSTIFLYDSPKVSKKGTIYVVKAPTGSIFTNIMYALNSDGTVKWRREGNPDHAITHTVASGTGIVYIKESYSMKKRGDMLNGTFLTAVSEDNGKLLWERKVTDAYTQYWTSIMTVDSKGRVYITTYDSVALYDTKGNKVWSYKLFKAPNAKNGPAVHPTLSRDEKSFYFFRKGGPLYSLNANTGKINWMDSRGFSNDFGVIAVSEEDLIFVPNDMKNTLHAFTKNGKIKWERELLLIEDTVVSEKKSKSKKQAKNSRKLFLYETVPTIGKNGDLIVNVVTDGKRKGFLVSLDRLTGNLNWFYKLGEGFYNSAGAVVDSRGLIYMPYSNGRIYVLTPEGKLKEELFVGLVPVKRADGNYSNSEQFYYGSISLRDKGFYTIVGDCSNHGTLISVGSK